MSMSKAWGVNGRTCAVLLTENERMLATVMIEGPNFMGPISWLRLFKKKVDILVKIIMNTGR